jgi:hypothetical protein
MAYQPPASSTFLHKPATSNQSAVLFSKNKSAPATSQTNRLHVDRSIDGSTDQAVTLAADSLKQLFVIRWFLICNVLENLGSQHGRRSIRAMNKRNCFLPATMHVPDAKRRKTHTILYCFALLAYALDTVALCALYMLIGGSFSVLPCDDRSPSPSA